MYLIRYDNIPQLQLGSLQFTLYPSLNLEHKISFSISNRVFDVLKFARRRLLFSDIYYFDQQNLASKNYI